MNRIARDKRKWCGVLTPWSILIDPYCSRRRKIYSMAPTIGAHPQAACDDHDVAPARFLQWPPLSEWPSDSQNVARPKSRDCLSDPTDGSDGMVQQFRLIRVRNNRNRHLTDSEPIDHIELAGLKAKLPSRLLVGEPQAVSVYIFSFPDLLTIVAGWMA